MPVEFLRKIADADLPIRVIDPSEVDKTRVLCAAGMITAVLPEPGSSEPAEILSLTGLGRATVKVGPPNA